MMVPLLLACRLIADEAGKKILKNFPVHRRFKLLEVLQKFRLR
jgi:hypothetical protein